jgi:competence protein ComEA
MPELVFDRRRIFAGVVILVALLALGARLLSRSQHSEVPPPVRVAATASTPTDARLYVHVVGAVRRPGLYRLKEGARVADAVARAGGLARGAQLEAVNLAAPLADGQQVVVPKRGSTAVGAGAGTSAASGPVHLNTATLEQLDALPGIGPVTAQKILDHREQHGSFGSVDELDAVPGIGPARLEQLRELTAP